MARERRNPMKRTAVRIIVCLAALVFLGISSGCATDSEVNRTKLPGVDKPAETGTGK